MPSPRTSYTDTAAQIAQSGVSHMPYAAEFQEVLERHAREIEDLRTIARLHGLPVGTPEHLLVLPLRLSQDSRLRSDVTELVRSLQTQDPDLGLPDALTIVLAAVAGSPKLGRRHDLDEAVDLTGGFLASLGGWPGSAVEPTIDIDNPPDHDPRLDLAASAYTETLEADLTQTAPEQEEVTVPELGGLDATADNPNGSVTLAEITHALARLERGNLELRLHLDSIDQRICRMEPLLEAVPHTDPQPPDPPQRSPLPAAPPADTRDLVHRGSSPLDPSPLRDRQEEVKALRRISLMSNFPDPVPLSAKPATTAQLPPPAVAASAAGLPGSMADPVSHPRMQQPRRDRFAAAREIPGNSAETDPLYLNLDEVPPPTELPAVPLSPTPAAVARPASASTEGTPDARVSSPEPAAAAPAVPEAAPAENSQKAGSRARLVKDAPVIAPRPSTAAAAPWIVTPPAVAMMEDLPPARSRTTKWVAGGVAAAVVGAAGFLYVNGLPAPINEWMSGSSTAVSSTSSGESPADATQSADPRNAVSGSASIPHASSAQRGATANGASPRVLGARESFNPSASVEKTNGPTFVPGGIMDGYLISAPRPAYPEMAKLVGSQGKVTFEAMVSKAGQVEAVKVLGGPQVLRSAATDAVKQWQYRPFQIKGRPVEVRTIIRVDVASHAGTASTE